MSLSRRTFLTAASSGTLMTALSPGVKVAFAANAAATQRDILVVVFLRFGCDGLTLVAPADDGDYHANRPTIAVAASGADAGLSIGNLDGVPFFMNPNTPELKALYDAKRLAVVHAVGLPTDTRSHFESQDMMERGVTESDVPMAGGWLARHLMARELALPSLGAVASAADVQVSLQGYTGAVAVPDVTQFNVTGGDFNLNVVEALNEGSEAHAAAARGTVGIIRTVQESLAKLPAAGGTSPEYPAGSFSAAMRSLATLVKMDVGLEVATVDFGGWDHHYNMNVYFPGHAQQLSKALGAFWEDMKDYQHRLTVVTMTEFGRRLQENTAGGTDHGSAASMFVLGGAVNGGRVYGQWPGLRAADLRDGDLQITTDSRHVLQEILAKRRGETALHQIFPTLAYQPLGILVDGLSL